MAGTKAAHKKRGRGKLELSVLEERAEGRHPEGRGYEEGEPQLARDGQEARVLSCLPSGPFS